MTFEGFMVAPNNPEPPAIQLHLGCGKRYIPGFVHIDIADFPHIDYRHDIRTLPMLADDSVAVAYACHVLEYFDRIEVVDVLREWRRVLVPGATLFTAVPDFAALVDVYRQHGELSLVLGPLFGRWQDPGGSQKVEPIYHRTTYDFGSLRTVLESAGFRDVNRYDWRNTIFRDYDDYSQAYIPHMDKEHGRLISLNVTCRK
jgi:SAM-dependent methyltransferase